MQRKYSSYRLPGDLEELSDFSNEDLRLAPEYAEVEEAYRKIKSFEEAVKILDDSEVSYNRSVKAVASIWPDAYEAFKNIDESLNEVYEKFHAERVMNAGFEDFKEERGEVNTRYRELENAVEEAKNSYQRAEALLGNKVQGAIFADKKTPIDYALENTESELFEGRATEIEGEMIGRSDGSGILRVLLDEA